MLSCSYTTTESTYSLYWYRQQAENEPVFIVRQKSWGGQERGEGFGTRFFSELDTKTKWNNLMITGLLLTDSALYYCAFEGTAMESSVIPVRKLQLPVVRNTCLLPVL